MAKKIKDFENKLKADYNINFQDNAFNVGSKGLINNFSKENYKKNEEEEEKKSNPVAAAADN